MITVSLVVLTYNRKPAVEIALTHNLMNAGYPVAELIHVDNGTDQLCFHEWFRKRFQPDVQIINRKNQGVARGYNRGLAMATQSHVAIVGCDRLMPDNWLAKMIEAYDEIPNTGAITHYSYPNIADIELRMGPVETVLGIRIRRAQVCEARFHSRQFLYGVGYFREDFGLYGYEDCEWVDRCERYARREGLINYTLPDLPYAKHLNQTPEFAGSKEYIAMKKRESDDQRKRALYLWCHSKENPYYNPYSQVEPDLLGWIAALNPGGLIEA